jgi:hypothetical protein
LHVQHSAGASTPQKSRQRAGDVVVEQPAPFDLTINLKTAATPGLTLPPALAGLAGEAIRRAAAQASRIASAT